jgi:hypothetical protein
MRINDTPNNSPEAHAMREREQQDLQDAKTNYAPSKVTYGRLENGREVQYVVGWQHGFNGNGPIEINPDCPEEIVREAGIY